MYGTLLENKEMIKYVDTEVTFAEFPDEVSLCINISNCPNRCPKCHSQYLWEDIGNPLTTDTLSELIDSNEGITCVGLMGGDREPIEINSLAKYIKNAYSLKVGWYSGQTAIDPNIDLKYFDYIKTGPYIEAAGSLDKKTTNQRMYRVDVVNDQIFLMDITSKFWKHGN